MPFYYSQAQTHSSLSTGLLKDNTVAQSAFLLVGGLRALVPLLAHPRPPVRMKTAHLLSLLRQSSPTQVCEAFREAALLALLVALVDDPDDEARAKGVNLLVALVQDAGVKSESKKLGLEGVIRDRIGQCDKEEKERKRTTEQKEEAVNILRHLLDTVNRVM